MIWEPKRAASWIYKTLGRCYLRPILAQEWKRSLFQCMNERPLEYMFALRWLSRICPSEVLDVGSGSTGWPHIMATCGFGVTAIDKIEGYWKGSFFNRHYYIIRDDITQSRIAKQFDFITCISVIEHIPNHADAFKGMFDLLKPGGHIVLTFPYNEKQYIDNVYALPQAGYGKDAPYICHVFSQKEIDAWLNKNQGTVIEQEYWRVFQGTLWTFGGRIYPPCRVEKGAECHLTCILIQKYGADKPNYY